MNFRKNAIRTCVLLATASSLFWACKKSAFPESEIGLELLSPQLLQITPIQDLNQGITSINSHAASTSRSSLKMNYRTYVSLGQTSLGVTAPNYPRIKKMANGSYILFYHNNQVGGSVRYATSPDARTFTPKNELFKSYAIIDQDGLANERRFSNGDALVLANGDIIAVASYRANSGYRQKPLDAGIALRRSTDNGVTWSAAIQIYQGVNWESYLLQLPSGEIHCYFTDSDRTGVVGTDTGTGMVESSDNGNTWTPAFGADPYYVLRTLYTYNGVSFFNNQMPSVIKLNNRNELAAAMEANTGDGYYISFGYSGTDGEWTHLAVNQEGPADRNDGAFLGSAPYLRQFPSGETVLSYNRSSGFHLKMGDTAARQFGDDYTPMTGGYWGSLELENSHQIIGVFPNPSGGVIKLAKFVLNHGIQAASQTIQVNGNSSEWANTDEALFVGEKSQAQATLRAAANSDSVYFLIEVLDEKLASTDVATLLISPVTSNDLLTNGARRFIVSHDGLRSTNGYNGGWVAGNPQANTKATYQGTIGQDSDTDEGYVVEIAIPRSKLNIYSGKLLVNFSITDNVSGEDAIFNTASTSTAKWLQVSGL
ncbi:MAG: hypothetical protein P0Y53_18675 [Candidatus Pseudobacter hemicellulosilyticus]|uniref:Exo-alpha-sialidase n=1 Tax=Candidatus Pseudobacter hemicellulosilyticus TaxID=3121375 RepID=A0AAJ5WRR7_9BACT|nr:MAG: hypothetical protein P0Y53_18675 [Pseudobacter sp.]